MAENGKPTYAGARQLALALEEMIGGALDLSEFSRYDGLPAVALAMGTMLAKLVKAGAARGRSVDDLQDMVVSFAELIFVGVEMELEKKGAEIGQRLGHGARPQ